MISVQSKKHQVCNTWRAKSCIFYVDGEASGEVSALMDALVALAMQVARLAMMLESLCHI